MSNRNTAARAMHDLGVAAWFGGSLMGSIGLNGAASDVRDPVDRTKVVQSGWGRWTPANLGAITLHLTGGAILLFGNRGRIAGQKGVLAATATKAALTAGAIGMTAYSGTLGGQVMRAGDVPSGGATEPLPGTPNKAAEAQKKLKTVQWAIPVLTGSIIVLSAYMGEQQRLSELVKGVAGRSTKQLGKTLKGGSKAGKATGKALAKSSTARKAAKGATKGLAKAVRS